jgi:hypothetical protein
VVPAAAQRTAQAYWTPARMTTAAESSRLAVGVLPNHFRPFATAPPGIPTAVTFGGVPTVGALFYTTGSQRHFCTASVVNSRTGDLILTAAHCVYGSGYATNIVYVPGYAAGTRPFGTWPVRSITVSSGWRATHDPNLDFAFLAVTTEHGHHVQAVTGGLSLAVSSGYSHSIVVIGYNDTADKAVRCQTQSFEFRPGQMEFYCHGFWNGTSGGPWITGYNSRLGTGAVHGVIGGYEQGGDYEWASYSSYFGPHLASLFQAAEAAALARPPSACLSLGERSWFRSWSPAAVTAASKRNGRLIGSKSH